VDEIARMDVLQATELEAADISPLVTGWNQITHHLPSQEQDSFDRELKMTANKEILKEWAKILNHHCIKAGFYAKPTHVGDPSPSAKPRIDMILVIQSVIFSFHRLEFNDDIFLQQNIMRKIYFICSQVCETNKRSAMQCCRHTGGPRRQSSFQPISPSYANEFHVHPM
jgi:hypothetical protein